MKKNLSPVGIFLGITFALTLLLQIPYLLMVWGKDPVWPLLLLMFIPGLSGLFTALIVRSPISDFALKIPRLHYVLFSYALPVLCSTIVTILLLAFDIDTFRFPENFRDPLSFALSLTTQATIFTAISCFWAMGEELGWRGYLHTHLKKAGVKHRYLYVALIWALWHWPLILFGDYATSDSPLLSTMLFTLMILALSFIMSWLRDISGSLWPAVIIHGTHNMWIQAIWPQFLVRGDYHQWFGGESGVFLMIAYVFVAIGCWRVAQNIVRA